MVLRVLVGLAALACSGLAMPGSAIAASTAPSACDCRCEREPEPRAFELEPVSFAAARDWTMADATAARKAFLVSCGAWGEALRLNPQAPVSARVPWSGKIADWVLSCETLDTPEARKNPKRAFEQSFSLYKIIASTSSKVTGYYEPEVKTRRAPAPGFEAAIPGLPDDLVSVDLGSFAPDLAGRRVWGKVENGALVLYPERSDITDAPGKALGYANPIDVFFLQIQGSGRLVFEDGSVVRAAFAAHNHRPFRSLGRYLIDQGKIAPNQASMLGLRDWLARVGFEQARAAMGTNPRYVFFRPEALTDLNVGPKGAQGVPLTPFGSIAVDPDHFPHGMPFLISTKVPERGGDWRGKPTSLLVIAQDVGGAIKGTRRADLFFGWGDLAGARAGNQNHEGEFYVLLPKTLPQDGLPLVVPAPKP
jgi:membrane-bound lytic murein transglycosylase A